MSSPIVNSYTFPLYPQDVDASQQLRIVSLTSMLLNVAGLAARENGFGSVGMMERGVTWVLSRFSCAMLSQPQQYDTLHIDTWVEDYGRLVTTRNFVLHDADGRELGQARSLWALIDMNTRHPVDMQTDYPYLLHYATGVAIDLPRPGKIGEVHADVSKRHCVTYSDVDFNRHANSAKYLEWMLDAMNPDYLLTHHARKFTLNYMHEAVVGQPVGIKLEHSEVRTLGEVCDEDGRALCRASIEFC